jgi:hypothetical protein
MNKILLGLLALGLAGTASADAINSFTWDTFSSDDKMYVCNVGIIHQEGKSGHVDENAAGASSGDTASTHDYLTVTYAPLNKHQEHGDSSTKVLEAKVNEYTRLFDNKDAHGFVVTNLVVNLSSENYGAKYYVDVCYRGAQIDYRANGIRTSYVLNQNKLTYSDHSNDSAYKYFRLAKLKVSTKTVCDTQLKGDVTGTDDGLNMTQEDMNIEGTDSDFTFGRKMRNVTEGTQGINFLKKDVQITKAQKKDAPRYCKTRYTVAETRVKSKKITTIGGYCEFTHHDLIGGIFRAIYSGVTAGRPQVDCHGWNNYAAYKAESYKWITTTNTTTQYSGYPRNWTRSGGTFTSLTEIENRGQN